MAIPSTYGVDRVQANRPAMIVEGVMDALSVQQEAGDLVAVVAAGSTHGGRLERWIGRLGLASVVLMSFDADGPGDTAASWWLKALGPRAKRWAPYWDDPNQLLRDGIDLRLWVREGVATEPPFWREVVQWPEVWKEPL